MQYSTLGSSGMSVSRVCLGSMTWGQQNTQRQADQQIEYAMSHGVNFIDTAEMYPVPPSQHTQGETERIIGNWLGRNPNKRSDIILATKVTGPGISYLRDGKGIDAQGVIQSVDASLKRLQTDYIDLYQLHWPNRTSPHFGRHLPNSVRFSEVDRNHEINGMLNILRALDECIKAGKIRHCGLSDDTTWGIHQYLKLAETHSLPKMVSIQNEFNLLHSKDWPYLIEHCHHEDIAFLPWSPLSGGMLSGKYLQGERPEGSRWTLEQRLGLFRDTPNSERAIQEYIKVAKKHDITPCQLALMWCNQVDGVTSTIIGATTIAQLQENIAAFALPYPEELADDVNQVLKCNMVTF